MHKCKPLVYFYKPESLSHALKTKRNIIFFSRTILKVVTLCYWNEKLIVGKKGVFCEVTMHCYNHKIPSHIWWVHGQVLSYNWVWEIVHTLTMTCGYPVTNKYVTLPITDQETLEIAFMWLHHWETAWRYTSIQSWRILPTKVRTHHSVDYSLQTLCTITTKTERPIWGQIFMRQAQMIGK